MNKWWYSCRKKSEKSTGKYHVSLTDNIAGKIFGIGKNGDMERSLLIETVCGLADIREKKRHCA